MANCKKKYSAICLETDKSVIKLSHHTKSVSSLINYALKKIGPKQIIKSAKGGFIYCENDEQSAERLRKDNWPVTYNFSLGENYVFLYDSLKEGNSMFSEFFDYHNIYSRHSMVYEKYKTYNDGVVAIAKRDKDGTKITGQVVSVNRNVITLLDNYYSNGNGFKKKRCLIRHKTDPSKEFSLKLICWIYEWTDSVSVDFKEFIGPYIEIVKEQKPLRSIRPTDSLFS